MEIANDGSTASRLIYAGFWLRLIAYIIDTLICTIFLAIIMAIGSIVIMALISLAEHSQWLITRAIFKLLAVVCAIFLALFSTASYFLYFTMFESSDLMATPGKLALGIIVTRSNGERLSFWRALCRNLAKVLSSLLFNFGFIMAAFTKKKQALHDKIASCLVVKKLKARELAA